MTTPAPDISGAGVVCLLLDLPGPQINGESLLAHALRLVSNVSHTVVVAGPNEPVSQERFVALPMSGTSNEIVDGALAWLRARTDADPLIVLHDVRRGFSSADLLERIVAAAAEHPDAVVVPVLDVVETVKSVGPDGHVEQTIPRDELRHVQTPQAGRLSLLGASDGPLLLGAQAPIVTVAGESHAGVLADPVDVAVAGALSAR